MIKKNLFWIQYVLLTVIILAYILLVSPYYLGRPYEVPDYFKFYGFAKDNLPTQDGFSTLFIAISSRLILNYELIHLISLLLISLALLIISIAFIKVSSNFTQIIIFITFLFSMGCWYYLYGKVFYEFPFIAFTFSILLYLVKDYLTPTQNILKECNTPILRNFYIQLFFVLCGFCISWKPHAVFPVFGLIAIANINNRPSIQWIRKNILLVTILIAIGYFIGNYSIFTDFVGSIRGIRGYNSGADIIKFLWSDQNSTWDHTNVFSFNSAVYSLWGTFFILYLSPLSVQSKKILFIYNLVFPVLFLLVVNKFLPGYPHNAFPFSLYLTILVFYVLLNARPGRATVALYSGLVIVVTAQGYSIATHYVPEQESWTKSSQLAIEVMEKNSAKIASQVSEIIQEKGPNYRIDLKVKRNSPYYFYNPLQMGSPAEWEVIFRQECTIPCVANYQIFIEPVALYKIPNYQRENLSEAFVTHHPEYVIGVKPSDGKLIHQSFQ